MKIYSKEMECPMCGKPHALVLHEHDSFYMDGVPAISMEQLFAVQALCTECGFMYTHTPPKDVPVWDIWHSEEYQNIMRESCYDETERKMKLCMLFYDDPAMPLYFSHYYAEIGNREKECEWLKKAIQQIESGKDDATYFLDRMSLKNCSISYEFHILPEYRLLDMYRRLGNTEKALKYAEQLRNTPDVATYGLKTYIEAEENWIRAGNTNIM